MTELIPFLSRNINLFLKEEKKIKILLKSLVSGGDFSAAQTLEYISTDSAKCI